RPWAAEVENTAEDINSSGNFREHRSGEAPQAFAFYSPLKILRLGPEIVKPYPNNCAEERG
ncbi:MAG: hypothetical protein WAN41_19400, partial [Candidatus Sulfotelmatobacter sp.]